MSDVIEALRSALGAEAVRTDRDTLDRHRADAWVLSELDALEDVARPAPLAVLEPGSTEEVARALALCHERRVPVVAFGGGSGVCGAIRATAAGVALSTRRLAGLRRVDGEDLVAVFGAGTLGGEAERALARHGLTLGHWPQSIELSTVGGWVATRASGQYSTAYGSIEDLVLALEVVLADGSVLRTRETPRAAAGPDLRQLFLGSEGTLGIVTEVTFSLRELPAARRGQAFHFASFAAGLEAIRRFVRAGWRPPVVRLYDARESERSFAGACPGGRALLILLHEGPEALVATEAAVVAAICAGAGGADAPASAVDEWLAHRNRVPGFRGFLEKGIILDTIEVACTWSRAGALYERTLDALRSVPGIRAASAHSSHSYRSGTNLYITFAARPERREDMPAVYRECWRRTLEATLSVGGGIAHHHGIGRVRRDALEGELGRAGLELLRAVKRALDPDGLMNPGVLIPAP